MILNEPVRNHKTVIVKNTVYAIAVFILMTIWFFTFNLISIFIFSLIIIVPVLFFYIYWYKTTITFTDDDVIVERNTIFKSKKTIPYAKIASVNADRDVLDRIFGTAKLKININSSRNAAEPEVILTFGLEFSEEVRAYLSEKIFNRPFDKRFYDEQESIISFSNKDLILHSIFGLSSFQVLLAAFLLVFSAFEIISQGISEGVTLALALVLFIEIIPMGFILLRYYNFKVFRIGDTVHIKHGAIQNYKSSFGVSRINAVRIRRTLFARLIGRAYIEAEVVGIGAGSDGDVRPMICILSKEENIEKVIKAIIPEFIYQQTPQKQPHDAKWPMITNMAIAFVVVLPIMVYLSLNTTITDTLEEGWLRTFVMMIFPLVTALVVFGTMAAIFYSMRLRELDLGKDLFTFWNGILDREAVIMNYDKVQFIDIRSGLVAKKYELAKCRVHMLSSAGGKIISSGYFPESELRKISDRMLERIESHTPTTLA